MAKVVAAESEVHIMSTQRKNMFKATDQYDRKETTPIFLIHQKPSSPVKDPKNKRNFLNFHLFHWWTVCSYYALYIPFKPVTRTRINGRFELKINKFQWLLCIFLMWTCTFAVDATNLIFYYATFITSNKRKAKNYLGLVYRTVVLLKKIQLNWILCTKRIQIENLLQEVGSSAMLHTATSSKTLNIVAMVYLLFVSASRIIISVFYMLILGSSWTSKIIPPSEQFHVAVVNGRKRFFFLKGFLNASTPHSPEDIVYGVSEILVKFLRQWDSCFEFALFCVVIPFTFWLTIEQFRKHFARPHLITNGDFSSNSESRLILEKYGELKRFVDSVNNIWSGVMLFWVFEMSLRNLWINNLFSTRNMVSIAHVGIETVFLTVAFVLMGEGSRIMEGFRKSLVLQNRWTRRFINTQKSEWIMRYLDSHPVGIGSTGVYQINYEFNAQILGFPFTLFVISFEDPTREV